ncbi:MAG TPA: ATP-binding cassette domain-containing protein [Puia sp.]|jgi:ABC-2 type transport system ATP-binding protein
MLELYQVQKSYGGEKILDIPNLQLSAGVYWLRGANGSGKTTLLRLLAGLLPFTGEVCVGNHSLRKAPVAYRRTISWADAEPLYPGFLSGDDLITFYRKIQQPPAGQIDELIGHFGVKSWLSSRAATWSSGMTKKLSLVLAFIGRPSLILLDEPLITLDQDSTDRLIDLIVDYQRLYGTSFFFSSHQAIPEKLQQMTHLLELKEHSLKRV